MERESASDCGTPLPPPVAVPCSDDSPEGVRDKLVPAFLRGISSHHAGCLPAWKSLVERCFQKGLLKLVFATGEGDSGPIGTSGRVG